MAPEDEYGLAGPRTNFDEILDRAERAVARARYLVTRADRQVRRTPRPVSRAMNGDRPGDPRPASAPSGRGSGAD